MHHLQNSDTVIRQMLETCSVKSVSSISHQDATLRRNEFRAFKASKPLSRSAKQETAIKYGGFLGNVTVLRKSRVSECRPTDKAHVIEETTWTVRPSFLSYAFEVRYTQSLGHISRTLSTYSMLSRNEPIFTMCAHGDIEGLQVAFLRGGISPFVLNEEGWSLLHVSILHPLSM